MVSKIPEYEVILVPMGINNSFNSGFRRDIAVNFEGIKEAEAASSRYGDKGKFGSIMSVNIRGIIFVFCYMDKGGYRAGDSVNYEALESCLRLVEKAYGGMRIASPLMGYGKFDGRGDKDRLIKIFTDRFSESKANVDLYVFESVDRKLSAFKEIAELRSLYKRKEISSDEYKRRRSEIEWRRKHGILNKMPDGYEYKPKIGFRNEVITVKKKDFNK